uniref:Uncharacterized protein n=1 Tax=Chenopodium quinoa TaxID=63459 RepID=A0A803KS77_CHEQI
MKRNREMRLSSFLKNPKKEEQQLVPENYGSLEEIKGFLGISNVEAKIEEQEDQIVVNNYEEHDYFGWDFLSSSWESEELLFPNDQEIKNESFNNYSVNSINDDVNSHVKSEGFSSEDCGSVYGFWDENVMEDKKASLNLNLNYDEVLEAWSNRGSLRAHHDHHHPSLSVSKDHYVSVVVSPHLTGRVFGFWSWFVGLRGWVTAVVRGVAWLGFGLGGSWGWRGFGFGFVEVWV